MAKVSSIYDNASGCSGQLSRLFQGEVEIRDLDPDNLPGEVLLDYVDKFEALAGATISQELLSSLPPQLPDPGTVGEAEALIAAEAFG